MMEALWRTPRLPGEPVAGWRRAAALAYGALARTLAPRAPSVRLAPARVISVGGLEAGGVGKTPCVLWWAEALAPRGRVAIVCRPYGSRAAGGDTDEVGWFRRHAPAGVAVVAGRRKWEAATRAVREGAEMVVVDDGFSHRRLARDLDLLLLDARLPFANRALLPAGPLREPPACAARADAVVLTRADRATPEEIAASRRAVAAAGFAGPVFLARHRLVGLCRCHESRAPAGARVFAVSALGRRGELAEALARAGATVAGSREFRDHARPPLAAWRAACQAAAQAGAEIVITAKDAARLPPEWTREAWVLEMEWEWLPEGEDPAWLIERATGAATAPTPTPIS